MNDLISGINIELLQDYLTIFAAGVVGIFLLILAIWIVLAFISIVLEAILDGDLYVDENEKTDHHE